MGDCPELVTDRIRNAACSALVGSSPMSSANEKHRKSECFEVIFIRRTGILNGGTGTPSPTFLF